MDAGDRRSVAVRAARRLLSAVLIACIHSTPGAAQPPASPPSAPAGSPPVTVHVRDWTRVEMWHFFEPAAGGGDPSYADIATRLQVALEQQTKRVDWTAALQFVQFGGLPNDATGPGPLGTGALYYAQGGQRADSHGLYLRYLNATVKDVVPGWSIQAGRFAYTSGAEAPSGDAKIEAVKRQRVDSRLLGEFEWSLYQRGFDGIRSDVDRPAFHATAAAFHPTQGGFENNGNVDITDIGVWTTLVALKPGTLGRHTDWEAFAIGYHDDRSVAARPDNSGLAATRVNVHVSTFGSLVVGAYPAGRGRQVDVLLWGAAQTGDWYGQTHRASAYTAEAGLQWAARRWKPWVRGGYTHASGDDNPSDSRHSTFFQILPTVRKYSLSATYAVMNLNDAFVQVMASPRQQLSLRLDVHSLTLADPADRWYFGSGATQATGTTFGYATRASHGLTGLGTATEGSADYRINPRWSINGYLGVIRGGDVVTSLFSGHTLVFGYVENVVQF